MIKQAKQAKKIFLGAGVLAALSSGGSALATAGATPAKPAVVKPAVEQTSGVDRDQIQSGDQTSPDPPGNAAGTQSAEAPGTGAPDASGESSGSEVAGNDGPGGHADEPGNANADYQFNGQQ